MTRISVNLKSMIDEYLLQKQAQVRKRTMAEAGATSRGLFKALHGMPVDQITRKDVAARLVAITREHGTVSAARARAALSGVLRVGDADGVWSSRTR